MPEPAVPMLTIEARLSDVEFHRVRAIAAAQGTSLAKLYQEQMGFRISERIFDEDLTGHECPWVG